MKGKTKGKSKGKDAKGKTKGKRSEGQRKEQFQTRAMEFFFINFVVTAFEERWKR